MNITIDMMRQVFECAGMTSCAKLVYFAIAYHASWTSGEAWPSRILLAKETGLNKGTISKALRQLEEHSLVVVTRSQTGNLYRLPKLPRTTSEVAKADTNNKKEQKAKNINNPVPPRGDGAGEAVEAFEIFWSSYPESCPRKVDKAKCRARYVKLRSKAAEGGKAFDAKLAASLEIWKKSDLWKRENGKYIRAPLVWLNNESWEDAPKEYDENSAAAKRAPYPRRPAGSDPVKPSWMSWQEWQYEETERRDNERRIQRIEERSELIDKLAKEIGL